MKADKYPNINPAPPSPAPIRRLRGIESGKQRYNVPPAMPPMAMYSNLMPANQDQANEQQEKK